jgi:hypothetical protein
VVAGHRRPGHIKRSRLPHADAHGR